ncbi:hypothetical protein [Arthrobacter sp. KK5.5]|uniref:hypothetical protein n=1 Tax=Arthrobacter sp. KK5.5 TaxID=3373084 RepID=UPI003EE7FAAC
MLHISKSLALPILLAAAGLGLVGCAQAEDAVRDAASGAVDQASEAASEAAGSGREALIAQLCKPVEDGKVSAEDVRLLGGLLDAGRAAGLPDEILDPAQGLADSGDQAGGETTADLEQSLKDACAKATGGETTN